jgi:hypothetical protein
VDQHLLAVDVTSAMAFYRELVNERPLSYEDVAFVYVKDLSFIPCQEDLYECPVCESELESRDIIGFDQRKGITCIGYECPRCGNKSKRPGTDLDYKLFLESISSKRSNKNRFFAI